MYGPTRDDYRDHTFSYKTPSPHAQSASLPRPSLELSSYDTRLSTYSRSSKCGLVDHPDPNPPQRTQPLDSHGPIGTQNAWCKQQFKGWRRLLLGSGLNLLLVVVPIAWILSIRFKEQLPGLVFIFCIIALIPLIKMHEVATRELSLRIGGSKAGLVNASLSNVVEIVVAVIALRKCELRVVQSSLIGSILSKLLLILGLSFFAGGMRSSEQSFDVTTNQINSSLLTVSVGVLVFPAAFHFALSGNMDGITLPLGQQADILKMSRGVSIVLMSIYMLYLLFQLVSHSHLYEDLHKKNRRLSMAIHSEAEKLKTKLLHRPSLHPRPLRSKRWNDAQSTFPGHSYTGSPSHSLARTRDTSSHQTTPDISVAPEVIVSSNRSFVADHPVHFNTVERHLSNTKPSGTTFQSARPGDAYVHHGSHVDLEKGSMPHREPEISWFLITISLIFVTVAVGFTADWLVESMDGISKTLNKSWIALVLLPAVSSIAECSTAIGASVEDQLTLSINVAVGSSIQTAFFVLPLMVNIAWMMGKPLSLLFDPFEALILYISVQTMSHVVGDGKSNWLEGAILICLYIIVAVCLWFYPGSSLPNSLSMCT